jgi:hypothetical protein
MRLVGVLLYASSLTVCASASVTLHVSPSGSDGSGDGSANAPFATPQRAQIAARAVVSSGIVDVVVELAEGIYSVPEPLHFDERDTAPGCSTTYRSAGGVAGAATLVGGVLIPPSSWVRTNNAYIWAANVSTLVSGAGTGTRGVRPFNGLVVEGVGATLARWPKRGSGYLNGLGCSNSNTEIVCPSGVLPDSAALVSEAKDMSVFCNLGSDWCASYRCLSSNMPYRGRSIEYPQYPPVPAACLL